MIIGTKVERLNQVDSTNNYAVAQLLTKRLPEGTVFIADCQSGGRGQINNAWESETGKNLTFSVVLYPEMVRIERQFEISKAISLAVADFLKGYVADVKIKWPNDIYVDNKKIAGILIENAIRMGKISSCIVGIGLNINQMVFVSDAPNPTSLGLLTSDVYDLKQLLQLLLSKISQRYRQLSDGLTDFIDHDYLAALYKYQQWAVYEMDGKRFEGIIIGVDEIGRLLIQNRGQKTFSFHFKEVIFCE